MSAKCICVRRDGTQMHSCIGQNTNAFEWEHMNLCSKRIWCITATKGLRLPMELYESREVQRGVPSS